METISFLFSVSGERKPGEGEDSFVYSVNRSQALLGVFDGCGGSGAERYGKLQNKTGAYLAARTASAAYRDWFEKLDPEREPDADELKSRLVRYLEFCQKQAGESGGRIPGRTYKTLPTTAAVALFRPSSGRVADIRLQWAGDSRVYLLDGAGLAQLTEDDLGGQDAMECLYQERPLSNSVNLTREFTVHAARLTMGRPGLLFAATDGCFRYLSTPMEFEYLLLHSLQSAASPAAWEESLTREIGKVSRDDFTLVGAALGLAGFDDLKRQLAGRTSQVYRTYRNGLEACSEEEKQQLWDHYKNHYYRHLCRP